MLTCESKQEILRKKQRRTPRPIGASSRFIVLLCLFDCLLCVLQCPLGAVQVPSAWTSYAPCMAPVTRYMLSSPDAVRNSRYSLPCSSLASSVLAWSSSCTRTVTVSAFACPRSVCSMRTVLSTLLLASPPVSGFTWNVSETSETVPLIIRLDCAISSSCESAGTRLPLAPCSAEPADDFGCVVWVSPQPAPKRQKQAISKKQTHMLRLLSIRESFLIPCCPASC